MATARRQHESYRAALEDSGTAVTVLPPAEDYPDSPFVEDAAVVLDGQALLTRPGAPSRRGEVDAVADALGAMTAGRVQAPATVDGGDVLAVGGTVFVGRSSRTDEAGVAAVREFAEGLGYRVTAVPVSRVLHLQSAVTALDDGTVLGRSDAVDPAAFAGLRWIETPPGERRAANVVALGAGLVLMAAAFPKTAAAVVGAGLEPVLVDTSEFAKADGGLTCLSLRW